MCSKGTHITLFHRIAVCASALTFVSMKKTVQSPATEEVGSAHLLSGLSRLSTGLILPCGQNYSFFGKLLCRHSTVATLAEKDGSSPAVHDSGFRYLSLRLFACGKNPPSLAAKRPPFVTCGDISPADGGITSSEGGVPDSAFAEKDGSSPATEEVGFAHLLSGLSRLSIGLILLLRSKITASVANQSCA